SRAEVEHISRLRSQCNGRDALIRSRREAHVRVQEDGRGRGCLAERGRVPALLEAPAGLGAGTAAGGALGRVMLVLVVLRSVAFVGWVDQGGSVGSLGIRKMRVFALLLGSTLLLGPWGAGSALGA